MYGTKLQQFRKINKWSILYMAEQLGIAKSTYAGYETGYREPSLETIRKAAALFGISTDELIGEEERHADLHAAAARPEEAHARPVQTEDAEIGLWFKELLEAPEERREELRQIWEIIKTRETGRTADRKQGE
jgi:transcriptional regulator with XRE-family HTH domain